MSRDFSRDEITKKKVRRVNEINTSRINKRKYYGVGVEKEQYKESLDYHVNHTAIAQELDGSLAGVENVRQEGLIQDAVNSADMLRDGVQDVVDDVADPIRESFRKGSRRAFDTTGDTLPEPDNIQETISELVDEQENYVTKLVSDMRDKAREVLDSALSRGASETEVKQEVNKALKELKDNRSETVAESETVKAAGRGIEKTFEENDVKSLQWVTEIDDSTCESGAFRTSYNGTTYTSCPELDGESFDLDGNHPLPVEDTHPNCRCILVAEEDDN